MLSNRGLVYIVLNATTRKFPYPEKNSRIFIFIFRHFEYREQTKSSRRKEQNITSSVGSGAEIPPPLSLIFIIKRFFFSRGTSQGLTKILVHIIHFTVIYSHIATFGVTLNGLCC